MASTDESTQEQPQAQPKKNHAQDGKHNPRCPPTDDKKDRLRERHRVAVIHEPKKGLKPKKSCLKRSATDPTTQRTEVTTASPERLLSSRSSSAGSSESQLEPRIRSWNRMSTMQLRRIIRDKVQQANQSLVVERCLGAKGRNEDGASSVPEARGSDLCRKRSAELSTDELRKLDGLDARRVRAGD